MRRLVYFLIILLTSAIWLSSCRSPQYVPVETKIQLKDSVITRDSVVIKEQTVRKDSVVIKDSTVIVVDESGNVIRTELYRYRDWYKELSRDYSVLQAKYDSLFNIVCFVFVNRQLVMSRRFLIISPDNGCYFPSDTRLILFMLTYFKY